MLHTTLGPLYGTPYFTISDTWEGPTHRWNALSVVSGALGELSRAPLKFLSVRHAVLYSDGYPLAVIGPLRYNFQTTSFPESHISGPRVSCFIPYISQYRHV